VLSFNNDSELKKQILAQLKKHHDADEIIKGKYWENGKGCAVGCVAHTSEKPHALVQEKYGIDIKINYLIDNIFEELPNELAKTWPLRIFEAIPTGIDTRNFINLFNSKVLIDPEFGLVKISDKPFIKTMGELLFKVGSGIALSDEELTLGNKAVKDAWIFWAVSADRDGWATWAFWAARASFDAWEANREKISIVYSEWLLQIVRGE
jgi:hypothetical protein